MDIKAKIETVINALKNDQTLMQRFQKNPVSVVEELLGVDLPEEQINHLIDGVKAKIGLDILGGLFGK